MEVQQQSGVLGPQADPHLGDSPNLDVPDSNHHIWIIEETGFAYRTKMVQKCYMIRSLSFEIKKLVSE